MEKNQKNLISLCWTKDGGLILITAKTQKHLKAHPESTPEILCEAIEKITLPRKPGLFIKEVRFNKFIGYSGKVSTLPIKPDTETTFAIRVGREKPSRIVIGKKVKIKTMVIIAAPAGNKDGIYELITAYAGTRAPKEPHDSTSSGSVEFKKSMRFWCRNALIYDSKVMGKPFKANWKKIIQGIKHK